MQDDMEFSPEQENSVEHNQDNDSQEEDEDHVVIGGLLGDEDDGIDHSCVYGFGNVLLIRCACFCWC